LEPADSKFRAVLLPNDVGSEPEKWFAAIFNVTGDRNNRNKVQPKPLLVAISHERLEIENLHRDLIAPSVLPGIDPDNEFELRSNDSVFRPFTQMEIFW
jgi:hypothetical protein